MDNEYNINSLANSSFDDIFAAHIEAFKDYPFQWGYDAFRQLLKRRGFVPALSFGAFFRDKLVSFTLNGIGNYHGIHTAYDTGTGTIETHRGRGLASAIFEHSVPILKEAGIKQYVLEVLEDNITAYSVYQKQGFTISRTFDCFRSNTANRVIPTRPLPAGIEIRHIDFAYREEMERMNDFPLSWQNSFDSLLNVQNSFTCLGAFRGDEFVGYGIAEPGTGDIPLLGVMHHERRKGIGSYLLSELRKLNKAEIVKVVNIEASQSAARDFVTANGIPKIVSQYEMIKTL